MPFVYHRKADKNGATSYVDLFWGLAEFGGFCFFGWMEILFVEWLNVFEWSFGIWLCFGEF